LSNGGWRGRGWDGIGGERRGRVELR